jgi:hypothetical protein
MMSGADSIDDVNVPRAGGTPRVFDEVYPPSTLGIFLREFTFGHANQLAAVGRAHMAALAQRTPLLPGIEERVLLDIDSLLRPVYGHQKPGASSGRAKIPRRSVDGMESPEDYQSSDECLTAHHEAGHAVAARICRGEVFEIDIALPPDGFTHYQEADADYAFVVYAGQWAQARALWTEETINEETLDGDGKGNWYSYAPRPPGGCRGTVAGRARRVLVAWIRHGDSFNGV